MKRIVTTLITLLMLSFAVAADNARFFCLNATENYGTSGATYRFHYSTVFDLTSYFNGTPIYNDYGGQNNPSGKLDDKKAVGVVGVANCNHEIEYTIDTNGGRFVSQSDPSKYRDFYVVYVSYYSQQAEATDRYFYYSDNDSSSSAAPSTKGNNNTIGFTAPTTNGSSVQVGHSSSWWGGSQATNARVYSVGIELFLCMDQLQDKDLLHLAQSDDYYATITVSWHCKNSNCTEGHSGSFNITVRGYYGNNGGQAKDSIFLLLEPTTESTKINIKDVAMHHSTVTIANFKINTTTKENFNWQNHLFAFLSASSDYSVSDNNGFILKKMGDTSTTIPYTLTVYNTTNGVISENKKVYDGRDHFTNATSAGSFCLDLTDYTKTSVDSFRDTYNAINYEGKVEMKLNDFAIPGSGNGFAAVMANPSSSESYLLDYQNYIGKYESQIYYHVVYTD